MLAFRKLDQNGFEQLSGRASGRKHAYVGVCDLPRTHQVQLIALSNLATKIYASKPDFVIIGTIALLRLKICSACLTGDAGTALAEQAGRIKLQLWRLHLCDCDACDAEKCLTGSVAQLS